MKFAEICLLFWWIRRVTSAIPPEIRKSTNEKHVDMMPLELNGNLNANFRQEVLLNGDERIDELNDKELKNVVQKMFKATDVNSDGFLSVDELQERIKQNVKQHLAKIKNQATETMKLVDKNNDHLITWDELLNYLKKINHINDRRDEVGEQLKFETADENEDKILDFEELLIYLHPENSRNGLQKITKKIFEAYDKNNDQIVSRDEFVHWSQGELDESNNPEFKQMEQEEILRRKEEFDEDIDKNHDGKATIHEIFDYVNPRNIGKVKTEVIELMRMIDTDNNGKLSLSELLERDWVLANSGLLSASRRLHDEM